MTEYDFDLLQDENLKISDLDYEYSSDPGSFTILVPVQVRSFPNFVVRKEGREMKYGNFRGKFVILIVKIGTSAIRYL